MQVDLNKKITNTTDTPTTTFLNFKKKAAKSTPRHNVRKIEQINTSLPTEMMPGSLAPGNQ